ncbi:uncharacterized protein BKA55DRAFT_692696 [Fusarium redolens]|uniref:Uncharacterized protein n=1 Tax=Fusarium redolens TaxID=48865 RepID=A0A9P9GPU9_FUSRE|nr:uncharacterized protein BKA55DRAFT_692696 [Fusarium redolens]KAH7243528.1 hypothetical protein BKA55DRAFT_692696 [Fusarium redolens]
MDIPLPPEIQRVHYPQSEHPKSSLGEVAGLSYVIWIIGIICTIGIILLLVKCYMKRRAPRSTAPPRGDQRDVELGNINDRRENTTKRSTVHGRPHVSPPPYCRHADTHMTHYAAIPQ